jgi:hypothetical protein
MAKEVALRQVFLRVLVFVNNYCNITTFNIFFFLCWILRHLVTDNFTTYTTKYRVSGLS